MQSNDIKKKYPGVYNAWRGMRERCRNTKFIGAKYYAKKGITVCLEWDDVNEFLSWSLDNGWRPGLTIDRKNGNKGYRPDNCRWATPTDQARNLSKNRILSHRGEARCISEWAEITGIKPHLIAARIDRLGWGIEKALTVPTGAIPTGPKPRVAA